MILLYITKYFHPRGSATAAVDIFEQPLQVLTSLDFYLRVADGLKAQAEGVDGVLP